MPVPKRKLDPVAQHCLDTFDTLTAAGRRRFVRVTMPGLSMFSRFSWKGEVVDGRVKLKPGFNTWHFHDMEPVETYKPSPRGTVGEVCKIEDITEEEFNQVTTD